MSEKFPEMDDEFEKLRTRWYKDTNVAFQIVDALRYREGVFLRKGTVHRCLKINALTFFTRNAERYHFYDEPFNIYSSLAKLPNMPMFSFNIKEKLEQKAQFNIDFQKYVTEFDFLIDIDNPELDLAYSTAARVKRIFDEYQVPYYLVFSGKKGFHFRVDYASFPKWIKDLGWQEIADLFKRFAENFRLIENLVDIDTSIFDLRRIAKVPLSLVYPNYFVALPLSDEQFNDFSLNLVSLPNLINQTDKLYKRGLLTRAGTSDGFGKLIRDYTDIDR